MGQSPPDGSHLRRPKLWPAGATARSSARARSRRRRRSLVDSEGEPGRRERRLCLGTLSSALGAPSPELGAPSAGELGAPSAGELGAPSTGELGAPSAGDGVAALVCSSAASSETITLVAPSRRSRRPRARSSGAARTSGAVALVDRRRDDQVDGAALVLEQHEDDPLGGLGALAGDDHPGDLDRRAVLDPLQVGAADELLGRGPSRSSASGCSPRSIPVER